MWIDKLARWIEGVTNTASRIVNSVGVGVLVLMMLFIIVDVSLRYFFNRPLTGTYEIIEFLMAIAVFSAMAYTAVKKGHIAVDLVTSRFTLRAQAAIESIVSLIAVVLCSLMSWQTAVWGETQRRVGTATMMTDVPFYPFIWVAAFGIGLLSLVFLVNLIKSLTQALGGSRWQVWLGLLSGLILLLLISAYAVWGKAFPWEISRGTVGIIGIVALILLIFAGLPIAFSMALVGFLGFSYLVSPSAGLGIMGTAPYTFSASHGLSVVPLFILMGVFAFHAGLTRELYDTAYRWLGHLPGGLAMATIGGCAGFSAICGSTAATAATMGVVALPEMKRHNYDPSLATACVAAGGSMGILIPPSIGLMVYGIIAEQSIGKLFMAGILPGVLLSVMFMSAIYIRCRLNITLGPRGPSVSFIEKLASLKSTWSVLFLFLLVIGGIYLGVFTPTEGAAIGAFGALAIGLSKRNLTRQKFIDSLLEAGKTTAMVFLILIGAKVFSYFLTVTRIPVEIANYVGVLTLPPVAIFALIIFVYLILGCFLSTLPMIIITVPIFLPVLIALGFDPIWFGVISILVCEMGLITPPVGLNVFIIHGVAKDVPMYTIFRGIWLFLVIEIICIFILVAFPEIALFLPGMM